MVACKYMRILRDDVTMVGCIHGEFGSFPSVSVCETVCKGDPDGHAARKAASCKKVAVQQTPAPCASYDAFTEQCTDQDCACSVTKAPCPMTIGGECRLYVPKPVPCAACGDKGAKA